MQYRLAMLQPTSEDCGRLLLQPASPRGFVRSDDHLVCVADERKLQQQRLLGKLLEPAVVRKLRIAQTELVKALRVSIDKGCHTKFLGESAQLAERCRPLHQIDEVRLDSSLREKTKSLTGVRTFPDSKDLNFQVCPRFSTRWLFLQ